jgi:hypothetical protein
MKTAMIVMTVISGLLIFSTVICGFWINSNPDQVEDIESSVNFHKAIALMTTLSVAVNLGIGVAAVLKSG